MADTMYVPTEHNTRSSDMITTKIIREIIASDGSVYDTDNAKVACEDDYFIIQGEKYVTTVNMDVLDIAENTVLRESGTKLERVTTDKSDEIVIVREYGTDTNVTTVPRESLVQAKNDMSA